MEREKLLDVILQGDCGNRCFVLEHPSDDYAVYSLGSGVGHGEKGGVCHVLNCVPYVVVSDV